MTNIIVKGKIEFYLNRIHEEFNFEKVHRLIVENNIEWEYDESKKFIPTLTIIKKFAYNLLEEAYIQECNKRERGFFVFWDKDGLHLSYLIEVV